MIEKNSQSIIEDVLFEIESALDKASSLIHAIEFASYYGLFAISNYSKLYDGGHVEQKFIDHFGVNLPAPKNNPEKESIHVISTSYQSGGHTRLMERLASMHDNPPDLVITYQSNVLYNTKGGDSLFDSVFDVSDLDVSARLIKLIIIFSRYKNVVLSIHPNDFIAAVAARISKKSGKTKIYFVNHADHLFSFGRTASDCVLEVSAFGEALGQARCPGLNRSFIGIPLVANWKNIIIEPGSTNSKNIFTSGLFWKFKPKLGYSLPVILRKILKGKSNIKLDVLGVRPIRDHWWWSLKLAYPSRVRLHNLVPFAEYRDLLNSSSYVLDSFPITGGTAFPEAIINGKITIGITGPVTGYTPADALRVDEAEDIVSILESDAAYREKLIGVLERMECVHGVDYVKQRYLLALAGGQCLNLLLPDFRGDPFFFEKLTNESTVLILPASIRHREISEMILELTIYSKFMWYFSFKSFLKVTFTLLQLPFKYFARN
jgi:hypothetical protein